MTFENMFSYIFFNYLFVSVLSADILAVFPHTGKSHFDVFEPLVLALAAKEHQVTVISFYPQKTAVANYTDISLVGLVPLRLNQVQFDQVENPILDLISMSRMGLDMCEKILKFQPVKSLLDSNAKFDLIIIELFNTDCFLSLVHKYGVPYVGISSANTSPEQDGRVGTPLQPAYVSHPDLPLDSHMNFFQRIWNVAYTALVRAVRVYFIAQEECTVAQLMGQEIPLRSLAYDVSVLLANIHHTIVAPRPLVPGHVEVGGIHIHPVRPLMKSEGENKLRLVQDDSELQAECVIDRPTILRRRKRFLTRVILLILKKKKRPRKNVDDKLKRKL
ncbi:UDP-glucuronosyltransferase 1-1 [Homalodisca vitripennis]|nr:UDP-glucuronosyltransferase 1-1 [Homalodisca vitripennis]